MKRANSGFEALDVTRTQNTLEAIPDSPYAVAVKTEGVHHQSLPYPAEIGALCTCCAVRERKAAKVPPYASQMMLVLSYS